MARKVETKVRGVYEREAGSGVWWICYKQDGVRHREKVGRRGDAIALYQQRKSALRAGAKLPANMRTKGVSVGQLLDDVLEHVAKHKDLRNYKSRAAILQAGLGGQAAAALTPLELTRWLDKQCNTPATFNRYKALISLAYKVGASNNKVDVNPARSVLHRKEPVGRVRYLTPDEYEDLHAAITKLFPEHVAEFVVSVHTGMRLTEQYTCDWSQVHLKRKAIDLTKTKNFSARTVRLNSTAIAAIESVRRPGQKGADVVSPSRTKDYVTGAWFHPSLREAGITGYLWHCNRHTFCSWLAMAGATERQIMEAAGHNNTAMAARYSHLSPAHAQSVVEMLSAPAMASK
jgi:integrase